MPVKYIGYDESKKLFYYTVTNATTPLLQTQKYLLRSEFPLLGLEITFSDVEHMMTNGIIQPTGDERKGCRVIELILPEDARTPGGADLITSDGATIDARLRDAFSQDLFLYPDHAIFSRYAPHQLIYTNPGTGKSYIAEYTSIRYTSVSAKHLIGFGTADAEHIAALANMFSATITIDEVQELEGEKIYGALLNAMTGYMRIGSGVSSQEYSVSAAFRFMGNPIDEQNPTTREYELYAAFENISSKISSNQMALGRRIAHVLFGLDYARASSTTPDVQQEKMRRLLLLQKKVTNGRVFTEEIRTSKDWLNMELPREFTEKLEILQAKASSSTIRQFLKSQQQSATFSRGAALRLAIARQDLTKDEALDIILNTKLESFNNVVEVDTKFSEDVVISRLAGQIPRYAAIFLMVVKTLLNGGNTVELEKIQTAEYLSTGYAKNELITRSIARLKECGVIRDHYTHLEITEPLVFAAAEKKLTTPQKIT